MNAMKKILALALAGVMALALLTGCGTGGSASHKSIAKAMEDYDRVIETNPGITFTSSAKLDAKLQEAAKSGFETIEFETVVKAVYNGDKPTLSKIRTALSSSHALSGKVVVYFYCGKYDKDAGKQAINLNAWGHSACISSSDTPAPSLADERQIGLITTSFTDDTTHEKVKVRFAVVVSEIPTTAP